MGNSPKKSKRIFTNFYEFYNIFKIRKFITENDEVSNYDSTYRQWRFQCVS